MRTFLLVLSVSVLAAAPVAIQEKDQRLPKSGDTIVVEGCLKGKMLEGADPAETEGSSASLPRGLNYQLKGKKDVLKDLAAKHDGQLVEITGVLKSNLGAEAGPGTRIGNTRIVIGVQSTSPDRGMTPGSQELLPVLEVKSYESGSVSCRR